MHGIEKAGDGDCLINIAKKRDVKKWDGEILVTDNAPEII
jgi:hypothetical protein